MKSFSILAFAAVAIAAAAGAPLAAPSANRQVLYPASTPHLSEHRLASPHSAFELIAQLKKTLAEVSASLTKANSRLEALIPAHPVLGQVQTIIAQLESDSNRVFLKAIGQLANATSPEELVEIAQKAALEIKQLTYIAIGHIQEVLFNGGEDASELLGQIRDIYSDLASDLHDAVQPLLDLIGGIKVPEVQGSEVTPIELLRLLKQLAKTLRLTRDAVNEAEAELESIVSSSPVAQDVQAIVAKLNADAAAVMDSALAQIPNVGSPEEILHVLQLASLEVKELAYVAFEEIKQVVQNDGAGAGHLVEEIQIVALELTQKVRAAVKPLLDLIEQIQRP